MKNIIIGILVLASIASLGYAFVQKTEATVQRRIAELNARMAEEAQRHAEQARLEAERHLRLSNERLEIGLREAEQKMKDISDAQKKK